MTIYTYTKPYKYSWTGDSVSTRSGTVTEHTTDTRSPLTRNKLQNGWRKPSAYNRTVENGDVYTVYTSIKADRIGLNNHVSGSGCDDCSGFWYKQMPLAPFGLEGTAITKALTKLKAQNVNYAQNIGERKQTAELVKDSCLRIAGMVFETRKTARKLLTDPFNIWLEIQYGWKPLLMDVHGAVSDLMKESHKETIYTVVGTAHDAFYEVNTKNASKSGVNIAFDQIVRGRTDVRVRLDYVQPDNPTLALLTSEGLTNPLDLAWELLPFSFVVDWFIPIGNYFNCLDAALGYTFKGGSCTTMQRMNYKASNPRVSQAGWGGTCSVQGTAHSVKMVRNTYNSSPLPNAPYFGNDRSSSVHVANGISLLASSFTKSLKVR